MSQLSQKAIEKTIEGEKARILALNPGRHPDTVSHEVTRYGGYVMVELHTWNLGLATVASRFTIGPRGKVTRDRI